MSNVKILVGAIIACLISFSVGRFLTPAKTQIKEVEKIVYKEKTDTETDANRVSRKREIIRPDGTRIIDTTSTVSRNTKKTTDTSVDDEKSKVVITENRPNWRIDVMYGISDQSYGFGIQRRILSEIYIGAMVNKTGALGVSIGVGF